jgi:hypothetical protein
VFKEKNVTLSKQQVYETLCESNALHMDANFTSTNTDSKKRQFGKKSGIFLNWEKSVVVNLLK